MRLQHATLYGILDLGYVQPEAAARVTRELLRGGVDVLQLRAKSRPLEIVRAIGRQIRPLCLDAGVPFVVNDHPDIAAELDADGLHLGQDDGPLADARRYFP